MWNAELTFTLASLVDTVLNFQGLRFLAESELLSCLPSSLLTKQRIFYESRARRVWENVEKASAFTGVQYGSGQSEGTSLAV